MKKILLLICLLTSICAFAKTESRMFIAAGRETFFNFPSEIMGYVPVLTVYLPEEKVPLKGRYPVVYFVGLDRSERDVFERFAKENQVLLVGIGLGNSTVDIHKTADFLTDELVPYIDTNYATLADPSQRIVAAQGEIFSLVAVRVFNRGGIFEKLALLAAGEVTSQIQPLENTRVFVRGTQPELAGASASLQSRIYGPDFFLQESNFDESVLSAVPKDYLLAPAEEVTLQKVTAVTGTNTLPLADGKSVSLTINTQLKNKLKGVFVPKEIRLSPPFLSWDAQKGMLSVIAGSEAGSVKISGQVDNKKFSAQIILKKQ